jgi:hypothetical protein
MAASPEKRGIVPLAAWPCQPGAGGSWAESHFGFDESHFAVAVCGDGDQPADAVAQGQRSPQLAGLYPGIAGGNFCRPGADLLPGRIPGSAFPRTAHLPQSNRPTDSQT